MTPERIAELRGLEQAATKAPWACDWLQCYVSAGNYRDGLQIISGPSDRMCDPNNQLIAAARNALPALLDEIERLREENHGLTSGLNDAMAQLSRLRAALAHAEQETHVLRGRETE